MTSRCINHNRSNNSSNGDIPLIQAIPIQINQNSSENSINFQVTNSNSDFNGSFHDEGLAGNPIIEDFINYHAEVIEGNEDEKINNFDITKININKSN